MEDNRSRDSWDMEPLNKKKKGDSQDSQDIQIVYEVTSYEKETVVLPPSFNEEWKKFPKNQGIGMTRYANFMKHMLTTGKLADVKFRLKGEVNDEEEIQAHKVVLKSKSEFFSTLFSDQWEQQDVIDLTKTGVNSADFKVFLEYLYTQRATIKKDNVRAIYYLTNMYLGKSKLKDKCESYLIENINEENVFELFNTVFPHDLTRDSDMLKKLIDFICNAGEPMLDRIELKRMDMAALSTIFSQQKFNCSPHKLLRFCLGWIKYHCGSKELENFGEVNRRLMEEFRVTEKNGDLKDFPLIYLPKKVSDNPKRMYKFSRFTNIGPKEWTYRKNRADRISFRVSEPIIITALGFYGDYNFKQMRQAGEPETYNLTITIYLHGKPQIQSLNVFRRAGKTMQFTSKTFKVDLEPCYLQSDIWYTIAVKMVGKPSYYGTEFKGPEVASICGNRPLVFEFKEACLTDENAKLANPTGVPVGQIPEIYFKLANDGEEDIIMI